MTPNNEAHVPWVHEYMGINLWLGLEIGRFRSILPQTTKKVQQMETLSKLMKGPNETFLICSSHIYMMKSRPLHPGNVPDCVPISCVKWLEGGFS